MKPNMYPKHELNKIYFTCHVNGSFVMNVTRKKRKNIAKYSLKNRLRNYQITKISYRVNVRISNVLRCWFSKASKVFFCWMCFPNMKRIQLWLSKNMERMLISLFSIATLQSLKALTWKNCFRNDHDAKTSNWVSMRMFNELQGLLPVTWIGRTRWITSVILKLTRQVVTLVESHIITDVRTNRAIPYYDLLLLDV